MYNVKRNKLKREDILSQQLHIMKDFVNFVRIKDESHFLLKCPKYNILRQEYGIDHENSEDSLFFIINVLNPSSSINLKTICLFLKEAFDELLLMFHKPSFFYYKLYIKNVFYLFQHVFVLDHASIVLFFPNKILLLLYIRYLFPNFITRDLFWINSTTYRLGFKASLFV